jgi:hypothetical protein
MTALAITDNAQDITRSQLAYQEDRAAEGFRVAAEALSAIRDEKLYRFDYETWDAYLEDRWGKSRAWFSRIALASETVATLPNGDALENESQVRALRGYPEAYRQAVLDLAVASAKLIEASLSASLIKSAGDVLMQSAQTGAVDLGDGESTALTAAVTQEQYETLQRQVEHIRSKGKKREYILHKQAVPAVTNTMTVKIPDNAIGETVFISVWTESDNAA